MTQSSTVIRASMVRYIQLLLVMGGGLTGFFFVATAIDILLDGRDFSLWISEYYRRILLAPWCLVAIIVVFDILIGWRYPMWRVDDSGISIFETKASKSRFVPWRDIASIRVYPLGVVAMTSKAKPVHVSLIVAVEADSARWLRDFAAAKLTNQ